MDNDYKDPEAEDQNLPQPPGNEGKKKKGILDRVKGAIHPKKAEGAVLTENNPEIPEISGPETPKTDDSGVITPERIREFNERHNVEDPIDINVEKTGHFDKEEGVYVVDGVNPKEAPVGEDTEEDGGPASPKTDNPEIPEISGPETPGDGPGGDLRDVKQDVSPEEKVIPDPIPKDPLMDHMSKLGMALAQTAAEMGGQMAGKGWDMAGQLVKMMLTQPHAMSSSSRMIGMAMSGLETAGDFADRAAAKYRVNVESDPKLVENTIRYRLYENQCRQANSVVGNTFKAISDSLGGLGVADASQLDAAQLHRHVQDMRAEKQRLMDLLAKDRAAREKGADAVVDRKNPDKLTGQQRSLIIGQAKHLEKYLNGLSEQGRGMAAQDREDARRARAILKQTRQRNQRLLGNGQDNPLRQVLEWSDPNANWDIDQNSGMPTNAGAYTVMLRNLRDRKTQEIASNGGRPLDPAREKWYQDMDSKITQHKMMVEKEAREAPLRQYGDLFVGLSSVAPGIGRSINQILNTGVWPSSQPTRAIRAYLSDYIEKVTRAQGVTPEVRHAQALLLSLDLSTRTRAIRTRLGSVNSRQCRIARNHHRRMGDKWANSTLDAVEAHKDEVELANLYRDLNAKLPRTWAGGQNFNPDDPTFKAALHDYETRMNEYLDKWFPLREKNRKGQGAANPNPQPPGGANPNPAPQPQPPGGANPNPAPQPQPPGGANPNPAPQPQPPGGANPNPAPQPQPEEEQPEEEATAVDPEKTKGPKPNQVFGGLINHGDAVNEFKKLVGDDIFDVNEFGRFETDEAFNKAAEAINNHFGEGALKQTNWNNFRKRFGPNPKHDARDRLKASTAEQLRDRLVSEGVTLDEYGRLSQEDYVKVCQKLDDQGVPRSVYDKALKNAGLHPKTKVKKVETSEKTDTDEKQTDDAAESPQPTGDADVPPQSAGDAEQSVPTEEGDQNPLPAPVGPKNDYGITYDMFTKSVDGTSEGGRRYVDSLFEDLESDSWDARENAYYRLKSICDLPPETYARIREQMALDDSSDALYEYATDWMNSNDSKRFVDSVIASTLADGIFGTEVLDPAPIEGAFKAVAGKAGAYTPEEQSAIISELVTIVNDPEKCTKVYEMFKTSALGGDRPTITPNKPSEGKKVEDGKVEGDTEVPPAEEQTTEEQDIKEEVKVPEPPPAADDTEAINKLREGKPMAAQMLFNQYLEGLKRLQGSKDRKAYLIMDGNVSQTSTYQLPADMKEYLLTRIRAITPPKPEPEVKPVQETPASETVAPQEKIDMFRDGEEQPRKYSIPKVPKLFDEKGKGVLSTNDISGIDRFVTAFRNLPHEAKGGVIEDLDGFNDQMNNWLNGSKYIWSNADLRDKNIKSMLTMYMHEAENRAQEAKEAWVRNVNYAYEKALQKYGEDGETPNKAQVTKARNERDAKLKPEVLARAYHDNLDQFQREARAKHETYIENYDATAKQNLEMIDRIGKAWYMAMLDATKEDPVEQKTVTPTKEAIDEFYDDGPAPETVEEAPEEEASEKVSEEATYDEDGVWDPPEDKYEWTRGDWENWLDDIAADDMQADQVREFKEAMKETFTGDNGRSDLYDDIYAMLRRKESEHEYGDNIRTALGDISDEDFDEIMDQVAEDGNIDAAQAYIENNPESLDYETTIRYLDNVMRNMGYRDDKRRIVLDGIKDAFYGEKKKKKAKATPGVTPPTPTQTDTEPPEAGSQTWRAKLDPKLYAEGSSKNIQWATDALDSPYEDERVDAYIWWSSRIMWTMDENERFEFERYMADKDVGLAYKEVARYLYGKQDPMKAAYATLAGTIGEMLNTGFLDPDWDKELCSNVERALGQDGQVFRQTRKAVEEAAEAENIDLLRKVYARSKGEALSGEVPPKTNAAPEPPKDRTPDNPPAEGRGSMQPKQVIPAHKSFRDMMRERNPDWE